MKLLRWGLLFNTRLFFLLWQHRHPAAVGAPSLFSFPGTPFFPSPVSGSVPAAEKIRLFFPVFLILSVVASSLFFFLNQVEPLYPFPRVATITSAYRMFPSPRLFFTSRVKTLPFAVAAPGLFPARPTPFPLLAPPRVQSGVRLKPIAFRVLSLTKNFPF